MKCDLTVNKILSIIELVDSTAIPEASDGQAYCLCTPALCPVDTL